MEAIDDQLTQLQVDEQLRLLDHVIDYVYVNFRDLQPKESHKTYKDFADAYVGMSPGKSRLKQGRMSVPVQPSTQRVRRNSREKSHRGPKDQIIDMTDQ